jgi:glycosyltransferase involved in cell wall biosynthesis
LRNQRASTDLSINIVSWEWDHGGGLSNDLDIVTNLLGTLGCRVTINGWRTRRKRNDTAIVVRLKRRLRYEYARVAGPFYDMNIFIQNIFPRFIPQARLNCLIPNPECLFEWDMSHMSQIDWVLYKTMSAVGACGSLARNTRYLGFTSPDKLSEDVARPDEITCLHIAGASSEKGTAAVVEAWRRRPDWPHLVVIWSPKLYNGKSRAKLPLVPNISVVDRWIDAQELRRYQNACAVHVCPSEAEGFGHTIVEGMSCGAVVVTTDGAPMNEIVMANRGFLVRVSHSETMNHATRYFVDIDDLGRQIDRVLAMTPNQRQVLGKNARQWYLTQRDAFASAMKAFLHEIRQDSR